MMMLRPLIARQEISSATWWHHRPRCPADRLSLHMNPWSHTLSDSSEDEWEALVKGRKWKAGSECPELNAFPIRDFWSISSPRQWPLTCCLWRSSDPVIWAVSSSASSTKGFFNKYSKQRERKKKKKGRRHFSVDVRLASLITHPSCYRAVIKVIWDIRVVLC